MSQHHGHYIRRSDSYKKLGGTRVRTDPTIQHCNPSDHWQSSPQISLRRASTYSRWASWQRARIPRPNARRITSGAHVRAKTRQNRVPRVPLMGCLSIAMRSAAERDQTAGDDALDCRSPRGAGATNAARRLSWVDYTDNDVKSGSD